MIKKILNHPLFSGSLVMVGGTLATNALGYLFHVVMGRMLGPIDYGVLAALFSIIYLMGIIPTSASVSIVKFISAAPNRLEAYSIYKSLERLTFKFAAILTLVFLIFTPAIGKFLHIDELGSIALVFAVVFLSLITLVNQATSQGLLKFSGSVIPAFIAAAVKLLLGVLLVIIGWKVFGVMIGVVVGMGAAYVYSFWYIRKNFKGKKMISISLEPFFKYSLPVLIQALAFTSLFTIDVILVKHFLSPFEAGVYGALSTLGKIIFFAISPISATMFPIVSGRMSKGQPYTKVLFVSFLATLALCLGVVVFYFLFPQIAIGVLYGPAYLVATGELFWMGLFMLFYSLSFFWVNFLLSKGDTFVVWFPLFVAAVQVPAIWFFHSNLLQVIQVCLGLSIVLFLAIVGYLIYNSGKVKYANHK